MLNANIQEVIFFAKFQENMKYGYVDGGKKVWGALVHFCNKYESLKQNVTDWINVVSISLYKKDAWHKYINHIGC